jgi:hypothetical protein
MEGEISYDLVMLDDMSFVEGTYRIGGGKWQVFIFRKDRIAHAQIKQGHWESGVSGIFVRVPTSVCLNKQMVELIMSDSLGVTKWREMKGPDSMQLR